MIAPRPSRPRPGSRADPIAARLDIIVSKSRRGAPELYRIGNAFAQLG